MKERVGGDASVRFLVLSAQTLGGVVPLSLVAPFHPQPLHIHIHPHRPPPHRPHHGINKASLGHGGGTRRSHREDFSEQPCDIALPATPMSPRVQLTSRECIECRRLKRKVSPHPIFPPSSPSQSAQTPPPQRPASTPRVWPCLLAVTHTSVQCDRVHPCNQCRRYDKTCVFPQPEVPRRGKRCVAPLCA